MFEFQDFQLVFECPKFPTYVWVSKIRVGGRQTRVLGVLGGQLGPISISFIEFSWLGNWAAAGPARPFNWLRLPSWALPTLLPEQMIKIGRTDEGRHQIWFSGITAENGLPEGDMPDVNGKVLAARDLCVGGVGTQHLFCPCKDDWVLNGMDNHHSNGKHSFD